SIEITGDPSDAISPIWIPRVLLEDGPHTIPKEWSEGEAPHLSDRDAKGLDTYEYMTESDKIVDAQAHIGFVMASRQHTRCWSPTMDKILIELLLDHTVNGTGRTSNNRWETETLSMMARELNQRFNSSVGDENVRARIKTLKRDYIAVKELLESTEFGFSYNQQTKCIDADCQAWDAYFRLWAVVGDTPQAAKVYLVKALVVHKLRVLKRWWTWVGECVWCAAVCEVCAAAV
ncbi:hypothetical protein IFM89_037243, partial [Coptis chinensis]